MSSINDDADEIPEQSEERDQARMVDWLQSWKAPAFFGFGTFMVLAILANEMEVHIGQGRIIVTSLFVAVYALVNQLRGVQFDRKADELSYPMYLFRRNIHLSKIADANCQIKVGEDNPIMLIVRLMGLTPNARDRSESKRYLVNLSGDFGARRVIFHDKYKRDQFLSLLRSFAPQVRITRWS